MDYLNNKCLHDLFEAQVEQTPNTIALIQNEITLNYKEVNERANQLAHHLQSLGVGTETLVGLYLERSTDMMIGLLAILKAGAAYVPLDLTYPSERLAFMISDAQLSFVMTRSAFVEQIQSFTVKKPHLISLDGLSNELSQLPTKNPRRDTTPDNLAYVIYTSGSTGQPKGVLGLHRGTVNYLAWMWQTYPFSAQDVCCQKTSLNFIDSIGEIFGPLTQGVPLVIIPDHTLKDIPNFIQTLNKYQVTRLLLVPSLLATLLDFVDLRTRLPLLTFWVTSGEALSLKLCRRFYEQMPNATLLNLYGSSEVSANASWYDTRALDETFSSVPIGQPIANTTLMILDNELKAVPMGVVGELYVGGEGLARGYLNLPDLTEKQFIAHPFGSGRLYKTGDRTRFIFNSADEPIIEFIGRVDHQVKIRGIRVELGEIEKTLLEHPNVRECVVTFNKDQSGNQRLLAVVVRQVNETTLETPLRHFLQTRLPDYMVPAGIMTLDSLPLTPNGKVNRYALPAFFHKPTVPYVAPRTTIEEKLSAIWQDVLALELEGVGINDRFSDVGGDSLALIRLHTKISQAFEVNMPMMDLLRFPTVATQADYLTGADRKALVDIEIVSLQAEDLEQTIQCVTDIFVRGEVLTIATQTTHDDFLPFSQKVCDRAVKDGLSLIAKNKRTGQVVGFSICEDFIAEPHENFDEILQHPKWKPVLALLTEMDEKYKERHPELKKGELLHILLSGSHQNYLGVASLLQKETIKLAQAQAYRGLISNDTGQMPQELSTLDGFEEVLAIDYASFTYEETTPFSHIKDASSCKLMLKLL